MKTFLVQYSICPIWFWKHCVLTSSKRYTKYYYTCTTHHPQSLQEQVVLGPLLIFNFKKNQSNWIGGKYYFLKNILQEIILHKYFNTNNFYMHIFFVVLLLLSIFFFFFVAKLSKFVCTKHFNSLEYSIFIFILNGRRMQQYK